MKTAGDLLREKRLARGKTLAEFSKKIKVREEYLEAIEVGNFAALPSSAFTKGFLRNYAKELGLNPDTIAAMFRRDYAEDGEGHILPKSLTNPVKSASRTMVTTPVLVGAVLFLSFLSFLGFQLWRFTSLPQLSLDQPVNGETYAGKVTVRGQADADAVVTINNQKAVLAPEGTFTLDLSFAPGTHSVIVEAVNRQNKSRLLQRTFQVVE